MKKLIYKGAYFMLLIACLINVGCSSPESTRPAASLNPPSWIQGAWTFSGRNGKVQMGLAEAAAIDGTSIHDHSTTTYYEITIPITGDTLGFTFIDEQTIQAQSAQFQSVNLTKAPSF